jgi:hypothetical protein
MKCKKKLLPPVFVAAFATEGIRRRRKLKEKEKEKKAKERKRKAGKNGKKKDTLEVPKTIRHCACK